MSNEIAPTEHHAALLAKIHSGGLTATEEAEYTALSRQLYGDGGRPILTGQRELTAALAKERAELLAELDQLARLIHSDAPGDRDKSIAAEPRRREIAERIAAIDRGEVATAKPAEAKMPAKSDLSTFPDLPRD